MTILKQPLSKLRAKSGSGPRVLIVVASVVTILLTLVEMFRGALTVGIGWDVVESLQLYEDGLTGSWDPLGTHGVLETSIAFTKGNSFQIISHVSNLLRGNQAATSLDVTPESLATQNLALVALSLLGFLTAAWITFIISRLLTASILTVAILFSIPVVVGHAFHNPKDIPTAIGYTLVTLGCILQIKTNENRNSAKLTLSTTLVPIAVVALGIWVAAGVRFALWLPLSLTCIGSTLFVSLRTASQPLTFQNLMLRPQNMLRILTSLIGLVIGLIVVLLSHPHYLPYLDTWITASITNSAQHTFYEGSTLTNGELIGANNMTASYLPVWFLFSIPIGLGMILLLGFIWILVFLRRSPVFSAQGFIVLILLGQALVLPASSVLLGSIMYNAQRQHLYMYPALAVIGALGVWWALTKVETSPSKAWRLWGAWGVAGFVAVSLIYPTIERQKLFPYEYTYLNELATINGVNGQWETDYWATSFREALTRVPVGVALKAIGPQDTFYTFPHLQGTDVRTNEVAGPGEYWQIQITNGGMKLPENCRDVDSVTRNFRGEDVVMSWVGICKKLPGGPSETQ